MASDCDSVRNDFDDPMAKTDLENPLEADCEFDYDKWECNSNMLFKQVSDLLCDAEGNLPNSKDAACAVDGMPNASQILGDMYTFAACIGMAFDDLYEKIMPLCDPCGIDHITGQPVYEIPPAAFQNGGTEDSPFLVRGDGLKYYDQLQGFQWENTAPCGVDIEVTAPWSDCIRGTIGTNGWLEYTLQKYVRVNEADGVTVHGIAPETAGGDLWYYKEVDHIAVDAIPPSGIVTSANNASFIIHVPAGVTLDLDMGISGLATSGNITHAVWTAGVVFSPTNFFVNGGTITVLGKHEV